jgi:hypothetical protein
VFFSSSFLLVLPQTISSLVESLSNVSASSQERKRGERRKETINERNKKAKERKRMKKKKKKEKEGKTTFLLLCFLKHPALQSVRIQGCKISQTGSKSIPKQVTPDGSLFIYWNSGYCSEKAEY